MKDKKKKSWVHRLRKWFSRNFSWKSLVRKTSGRDSEQIEQAKDGRDRK